MKEWVKRDSGEGFHSKKWMEGRRRGCRCVRNTFTEIDVNLGDEY